MSRDNLDSSSFQKHRSPSRKSIFLKSDNVAAADAPGLAELGITPQLLTDTITNCCASVKCTQYSQNVTKLAAIRMMRNIGTRFPVSSENQGAFVRSRPAIGDPSDREVLLLAFRPHSTGGAAACGSACHSGNLADGEAARVTCRMDTGVGFGASTFIRRRFAMRPESVWVMCSSPESEIVSQFQALARKTRGSVAGRLALASFFL